MASPVAPDEGDAEDPEFRSYPIYALICISIVLTGGVGNSFLIYLSFKKSKLMTAINQLLLSQCFINMGVCFVAIPIKVFLEATGLVFPLRDDVCWVVLSWSYSSWASFCFSLCVVASVRLLYTVTPLWMHNLREGRVAWVSCGILLLCKMAWFVASMLLNEPPFGSVTCFISEVEHSSLRIIAALSFNLICLLITLGTYLGITCSTSNHPLPTVASSRHRNLITARTGIIQCVFFLLTYLLPIAIRLLSYKGVISPTTLSQWNFFFVFFFQCSVYPFLTILSSSVLRKETQSILVPLRTRLLPIHLRRQKVEPEIVVVADRTLAPPRVSGDEVCVNEERFSGIQQDSTTMESFMTGTTRAEVEPKEDLEGRKGSDGTRERSSLYLEDLENHILNEG